MSSNEAFHGKSNYGRSFSNQFSQLSGVGQLDPYDYQRQLQRQQTYNARITSQAEIDYQAEIAKAEEEIYYLLS